MSRTRNRLGAIVAVGVLSATLSACAADDSSDDDATTPAATAESNSAATGDAGAEDTAADTAAGEAAEGEEIPVEEFLAMLKEPGEETLSSYTMVMTMDVEGQQMDIDGAVDLGGDTPAMQMVMNIPEMGEVEMIIVDSTVFMAIPGMTPEGTYVEAPPELTADLGQLEDIDVSSQWDAWEEGAEKVVFVGTEDVDGSEMSRYEITVSEEAIDAAMETAAGEMGDDAAATSMGLDGPVVYDVWLDEDNLMRRMTMDVGGTPVEMTMDNWGEPQDIQAPSSDEVVDPSQVTGEPTG